MKQTNSKLSKQDRDQLKRLQIITAARRCVANKGFHATSMNEIAKTASMSVGHIYRYFENKEDIIRGIVEKIAEEHLLWIASTVDDKDRASIHIDRFSEKFMHDKEERAILLEVTAEAARNPSIAKILQKADKQFRDLVVTKLRRIHPHLDEAELYVRVEFMATLSESFLLRSIKGPEADPEKYNELFARVVKEVWN